MGLTFTVGNPTDAFVEEFGRRVRSTFENHYGDSIVLDSADAPYYSEELGWSGWRLLQEKALTVLAAESFPHFLSMEAWCGCFVPVETQVGSFTFDGEPTPLDVASLPALLKELEAIGRALGLPTDDDGLRELAAEDQDDDPADEDMATQTYAELLLAARVAWRRRQGLWIVK